MTGLISKIIGRFGYAMYFFFITVAFLYYQFPSDKISDYLQTKIGNVFPSYELSIIKTSISAPIALKLYGVEVSPRKRPDLAVFTAANVILSPVIPSFFSEGLELNVKCNAYGGNIGGTIHIQGSEVGSQIHSIFSFENLNLEKGFPIMEILGDSILGTLSGRINLTGNYKDLINSSGDADISLHNIELSPAEPILGLDTLNLQQASIKIAFKNRKASINSSNFKSEILSGTLSGNIQLRDELGDSILALKGTLEPFAGFIQELESSGNMADSVRGSLKRGHIPFIIRGTLKDYKVVI